MAQFVPTTKANSFITTGPVDSTKAILSHRRLALMYWALAVLFAVVFWRFKLPTTPQDYAVCSPKSRIYVVNPSGANVQCIVVRGDVISHIGNLNEIQANAPNVKIITLNPHYSVVPGLADAHAHILEYGFKRQLELDGSQSINEVISRVRKFITDRPEVYHNTSFFIAGMGWDQTKWPGGQFPTAADLEKDILLAGRPIALRRVDGHAAWVSQAVLKMISPLPSSIEGGEIIRSPNGVATGVFLDNAMKLIPYPAWSETQELEYFNTAMKDALSFGLTSIHDAFTTPEQITFFKRMADIQNLPIRIYMMGGIKDDEYWGGRLKKLDGYGKDKRLTLRSVKIVGDGALGSWGAALLSPYSDNPTTSGFLLQSEPVLASLIQQFLEDRWQVNVHCIGDRANHVLLNIFENLQSRYNLAERRSRIEHAQIMTIDDLKRIGDLGVIPSIQPTHATSDMAYAESRLGPDRIKGAYAYRTLLETSRTGNIALGSDFPIEGVNPLLGFYAAVSRLTPDGTSPHGPNGWFIDQALTREQALHAMTLGAAWASFSESSIGSLEVGKKADFVIFDQDIMSIPQNQILQTAVVATVIDGRVAFGQI